MGHGNNVFSQIASERNLKDSCLSLEEFKKALIRLAVINQGMEELPASASLDAALTERLMKNGALKSFLGFFVSKAGPQSPERSLMNTKANIDERSLSPDLVRESSIKEEQGTHLSRNLIGAQGNTGRSQLITHRS